MKAIEKAMLIKELHQLIDGLEHQPLSFLKLRARKNAFAKFLHSVMNPFFKNNSKPIRR